MLERASPSARIRERTFVRARKLDSRSRDAGRPMEGEGEGAQLDKGRRGGGESTKYASSAARKEGKDVLLPCLSLLARN